MEKELPKHCIITSEARRIPATLSEGNAYIDDCGNRRFKDVAPVGHPDEEYAGVYALESFPGCFWWVETPPSEFRMSRFQYPPAESGSVIREHAVLSTEELMSMLPTGKSVFICDGPFDNRDSAHYALDVAWEAPA